MRIAATDYSQESFTVKPFFGILRPGPLLLVPAVYLLVAAAAAAPPGRPNVVFFFTDDQRPDTVGALGNEVVQTPNIDRLYERGFRFSHAYCMGSYSGAVCRPSRTMVLSGRHVFDIDQYRDELPAGQDDADLRTWPAAMKAAGYVTMRTGKKSNQAKTISAQFDENVDLPRSETCTREHADNAIRFIRENAGKTPFFLYVAFGTPHDPQPAPQRFLEMYDADDMPLSPNFVPLHPFDNGEMTVRDEITLPHPRTRESVQGKLARYYASISYTDDQIGRMIEALHELGQLEETLIIFSSDNGLSLGDHGLLGKQNLYENGGMHVPLAFAGPGIPTGRSDALVYLSDLYPTVCDVLGLDVPREIGGRSFAGVVRGTDATARDAIFGVYKGVQRSVRTDRWKLIRYPQVDRTQLFDLQQDPHEMADLAGNPGFESTEKELMALLRRQQQLFNDPGSLDVANPASGEVTLGGLERQVKAAEEEKRLRKEKRMGEQKRIQEEQSK